MDTVHGDEGGAIAECDVDDDELVDVFHVVADTGIGEAPLDCGVDDDVAGGTVDDFAFNVAVEAELAVCPPDIDLRSVSSFQFWKRFERKLDVPSCDVCRCRYA